MSLKNILYEALTKTDKEDIKTIIAKELSTFKTDLDKEYDGKIEDTIRKVVPDTFERYHQILWQRRASWSGALKK